ncbi:MAG: TrkA family potassium uptake protein, partial [Pygmaiobacter sp.]
AVASVTSDDNINIMVAEVATQFFGIKNVFARIYDPVREKVFAERMDLHTICPTRLTIDAVLGSLTKEEH